MGSHKKKRQTIAKRNRERAVEEKRTLKRQKKQAQREAERNGEPFPMEQSPFGAERDGEPFPMEPSPVESSPADGE
ncbi:MAG: hypothetical protein WBB76_11570 [Gaiellaceae bacterium]